MMTSWRATLVKVILTSLSSTRRHAVSADEKACVIRRAGVPRAAFGARAPSRADSAVRPSYTQYVIQIRGSHLSASWSLSKSCGSATGWARRASARRSKPSYVCSRAARPRCRSASHVHGPLTASSQCVTSSTSACRRWHLLAPMALALPQVTRQREDSLLRGAAGPPTNVRISRREDHCIVSRGRSSSRAPSVRWGSRDRSGLPAPWKATVAQHRSREGARARSNINGVVEFTTVGGRRLAWRASRGSVVESSDGMLYKPALVKTAPVEGYMLSTRWSVPAAHAVGQYSERATEAYERRQVVDKQVVVWQTTTSFILASTWPRAAVPRSTAGWKLRTVPCDCCESAGLVDPDQSRDARPKRRRALRLSIKMTRAPKRRPAVMSLRSCRRARREDG